MPAAQDILCTLGMIVLRELKVVTRSFVEVLLVKAFEEKSPFVAEHFRLDQQHIQNGQWRNFHANTLSRNKPIRYWP